MAFMSLEASVVVVGREMGQYSLGDSMVNLAPAFHSSLRADGVTERPCKNVWVKGRVASGRGTSSNELSVTRSK